MIFMYSFPLKDMRQVANKREHKQEVAHLITVIEALLTHITSHLLMLHLERVQRHIYTWHETEIEQKRQA